MLLVKDNDKLRLVASKNPGKYVSYNYCVQWIGENGQVRTPKESSKTFISCLPFVAAGKTYFKINDLCAQQSEDRYFCRDIHGREVFAVRERFPCFDSYDFLYEDRYFRWFYIQHKGRLCCVKYTDDQKTIKVIEDISKVDKRAYEAMKETGYCPCIEES